MFLLFSGLYLLFFFDGVDKDFSLRSTVFVGDIKENDCEVVNAVEHFCRIVFLEEAKLSGGISFLLLD